MGLTAGQIVEEVAHRDSKTRTEESKLRRRFGTGSPELDRNASSTHLLAFDGR